MENAFEWQAPTPGDVTASQLAQFRAVLLKKVLLSPVMDQGFQVASQKLRAIAEDYARTANQLEPILDQAYQLSQAANTLHNVEQALATYKDSLFTSQLRQALQPSLEEIRSHAIHRASLPPEQQTNLAQLEDSRRALAGRFTRLQLAVMALHRALAYSVQALALSAEIAALILVLCQMALISDEADKHIYSAQSREEDRREIQDFVLDHALEAASWVMLWKPVTALFQLFFHNLRQEEDYEKQLNEFIQKTDMDLFALNYFHWWTEEGGSQVVQSMLPTFSSRVDAISQELRTYTNHVSTLNAEIDLFQSDLDQYLKLRLDNFDAIDASPDPASSAQ